MQQVFGAWTLRAYNTMVTAFKLSNEPDIHRAIGMAGLGESIHKATDPRVKEMLEAQRMGLRYFTPDDETPTAATGYLRLRARWNFY